MPHHETQGLLSPLIRDIRLKQIGKLINPNSVVLDFACGAGYLRNFLPENCQYYGIDRLEPPSTERFDSFANLDLMDSNFEEEVLKWLPRRPNVITLVAFVEHITDPKAILQIAARILQPGGLIALTTPHPSGRRLHDMLASTGILSQAGADEHEDFLDETKLRELASSVGENCTYKRFLFGLNQVVSITTR